MPKITLGRYFEMTLLLANPAVHRTLRDKAAQCRSPPR